MSGLGEAASESPFVIVRRREDFFQCHMNEGETLVEFVMRMWVRWLEARPYGVDDIDGVTFLAGHLPLEWSDWAYDLGQRFCRSDTFSARPVGDMPGFVHTLMREIISHLHGPPLRFTVPPPMPPTEPIYDPLSHFLTLSGPYYFLYHPTHPGYYYVQPPRMAPFVTEPPIMMVAPTIPEEPSTPSIEEIFLDQSGKSHENPIDIDSESIVED